eukprot:sb/3463886/
MKTFRKRGFVTQQQLISPGAARLSRVFGNEVTPCQCVRCLRYQLGLARLVPDPVGSIASYIRFATSISLRLPCSQAWVQGQSEKDFETFKFNKLTTAQVSAQVSAQGRLGTIATSLLGVNDTKRRSSSHTVQHDKEYNGQTRQLLYTIHSVAMLRSLDPLHPIFASRIIGSRPVHCINSRARNKSTLFSNHDDSPSTRRLSENSVGACSQVFKDWSCLASILTHYSSNADTRGGSLYVRSISLRLPCSQAGGCTAQDRQTAFIRFVCEIDLGRCATSISLRLPCCSTMIGNGGLTKKLANLGKFWQQHRVFGIFLFYKKRQGGRLSRRKLTAVHGLIDPCKLFERAVHLFEPAGFIIRWCPWAKGYYHCAGKRKANIGCNGSKPAKGVSGPPFPPTNFISFWLNYLKYRIRFRHATNIGCNGSKPGEPTDKRRPIKTRYLGHVTGYHPIRDQYFLILFPDSVAQQMRNGPHSVKQRLSPNSSPHSSKYQPTAPIYITNRNRPTQVNNQSEYVIKVT